MSPAPKRSKKKAAAEATATATRRKGKGKRKPAVEEDEDEDEDEATPATKGKGRGRVAKDYGVSGEDISNMRDDGMSWQEIQDEVGAKSAIPLRVMLQRYQAEQDEDEAIDIDDEDAILAARDEEGLGWGQIAARANSTVAQVKAAYTEAGGENLDGRAYKAKDGTVHFKIGATSANGAGDDDEEDEDNDYADMSRAELVAELKERGLDTKGKSPVLIARLMENDEEDEDEDEEPEPEPEPTPRRAKAAKGKKKSKAGR